MSTLALYEMDSIGVNGALEAVATHWFCSETCRNHFAASLPDPIAMGTDDDWADGTVCDDCGKALEPEPDHAADQLILADNRKRGIE